MRARCSASPVGWVWVAVLAACAQPLATTAGEASSEARAPFPYQLLFPAIANASEGAARHDLPAVALLAHGHDVRPPKARLLAHEGFVCFRSPVVAALRAGQVQGWCARMRHRIHSLAKPQL